ncbi:MAG: MvaI/BcnI family restriction endonuclease [Elusimicrobiota bacterium]
MTLTELKKRLKNLKDKGFISSKRKGPTGIGYTFETELNLKETNIAIPDLGGRIELKTMRETSGSLVTLFTFNKSVWKIHPKDAISKYGYFDENKRHCLYVTVAFGTPNNQGLLLDLDKSGENLQLKDKNGILIGNWKMSHIVAKFLSKMGRLIIVYADTRKNDTGVEEFFYKKAYLLENPSDDNFVDAIKKKSAFVDIRMYLRPDGSVRNHGTGFRVYEKDLGSLYQSRRQLI